MAVEERRQAYSLVKGFLLDENLPCRLRFSLALPAIHATELGKSPSDSLLWDYAKSKQLVILTKDTDFSGRITGVEPPPWVVHFRIGNVKRDEFHEILKRSWPQILNLLHQYKLVNAFRDRIEAF